MARLRVGIGAYTFQQKQDLVRLIVPGDRTHRIIAEHAKTLTVNGIIDFHLNNTLVRKTVTKVEQGKRAGRGTVHGAEFQVKLAV